MAIDLGTVVTITPTEDPWLLLRSDLDPQPAQIPLHGTYEGPLWGRLAAAVAELVGVASGGIGDVASTLPVGAGLSSSAAFCVALALALGCEVASHELARICQGAEARVGAHVGLMDPLVAIEGTAGHALLIDFSTLRIDRIRVPSTVEIVAVHSGEHRALGATPYGERRAECAAAADLIGSPLGTASIDALTRIDNPRLRSRARHVVTECARVRQMAEALGAGDLETAGHLMVESHRSLAVDFGVTTPTVDALVARLLKFEGVFGARMTGGGFGGCVVALCRQGALDSEIWPGRAWHVRPSNGAAIRRL